MLFFQIKWWREIITWCQEIVNHNVFWGRKRNVHYLNKEVLYGDSEFVRQTVGRYWYCNQYRIVKCLKIELKVQRQKKNYSSRQLHGSGKTHFKYCWNPVILEYIYMANMQYSGFFTSLESTSFKPHEQKKKKTSSLALKTVCFITPIASLATISGL